jgi:transcriptional regulator with XRE-family HTH domain
LIKFLKDAPRDLIHAINHTFYPNLIPILQSLFPNQAIHINNKSDDVKKLDYYFQNPSSLGRLFFGARKRLKGKPNPKDLAIKLGKSSEKYINDREWDRLKPTPSYFSDWVWFFNQLDLSLEDHLLPHLKQFGIHETSPSFLLAKAMNGMTGLELAVKTGLKPITITNILNGKETQLSLDQLFELKKILPHLNPHFFSQLSPQVTNIFPEITREPHSLNVPREDQIEAEKINLASLVANYRTNHRLTNIEMAVILGLSEASVRRLAMGVKVDFDLNALSRISAVLEINPRYLLLKFKPQILKIFPIDDQISETPNHLAPHWEKLKSYEPISNYLKQLRKTKKINQEVVNKLIKKITGKSINVSRYENNKNLPIPFSILKILSYIYDVNLNDIIYSSNLTLFPNLDPDIWMMPTYPIYLEKPHEAKLIEFFNRTDPEKRSIGWLIFSFLKNPFNYKTIQQFASETKIGKSSLDHIIHHRYIPNLRTIEKLSSSLPFSWEQIIEAINHTFHQDLIETLTEVFPEKAIWIDPNSNDIEKVKLYAKNPGSIGKVLFEFRKSQPDLPGVVEMSLRFKKANDYWFKREMNQVEVTPDNLHSWIWIFQKLKIPLETLKPFLNKIQLTSDSPRYLLSVAMGEETLVALAKRSGVDVSILVDLNTSKIKPTAKTLLKLKTALPTLEIGKLYRTIFPELIEFFPEAESSIPYLNLTPVSIADAKSLEVNELVFDYMKKNNISAKKMAKILGVSDTTILYFIKNKSRLRYDYLLLKMAVLLNIPRQTLYLHYHPEILDFFSINNPELLK